jgi:hypothetical protein
MEIASDAEVISPLSKKKFNYHTNFHNFVNQTVCLIKTS